MFRTVLIIVLLFLVAVLGQASLRPSAGLPIMAGSNPTGVPQDADLNLSVSERRLAQEMANSLAGNPNLRDPAFDLAPPDLARVTVSVYTTILGQTLQIRPTVEMRFALQDGIVQIVGEKMEIGGLPMPDWVADLPMREFTEPIERQVNDTVRRMEAGSGLQLTSVSATEDSLVLGFS